MDGSSTPGPVCRRAAGNRPGRRAYARVRRACRSGRLRRLMDQPADTLVHRLHRMAAWVRRDQHRMTAFVRFRILEDDGGPCSVAWYQPQRRILRRITPFFIDRFASLRFSILDAGVVAAPGSPERSVHRRSRQVIRSARGQRRGLVEALLLRNVQPDAGQPGASAEPHAETLPARPAGTDSIPELLRNAGKRTDGMTTGR